MASLKQPPIFYPSRGDCYVDWKSDVEIWGVYTKDEKSRRGPAVYLSLVGDAREAVRSLKVDDLAKDNGLKLLVAELDKVYLKEETTRAFCAVKAFVEFRRESGMNFTKFLVEFNNKYREVQKYKLELNSGLKGYFLMASANLSADHERLVRATAQLTFDDIKDKLQKVFGKFGDDEDDNTGVLPVKDEICLYTKSFYKGRGSQRGGYRGRGSFQSGRGRGGSNNQPKRTNPTDRDGSIMRCHECESTKHFVSDCPHRQVEKVESANVTVHLTLVAGTTSEGHEENLVDTLGKGILDTACTKSVAGEVWMKEFLGTMEEKDRQEAEQSKRKSRSLFKFGDGRESKSNHELTIPMFVGGKTTKVDVDVVGNDIPLLISRPTMTKLGMVVDTKNHQVTMDGKTQELNFNTAGHYVVSVNKWTYQHCKVVVRQDNLLGT